MAVHQSAANLGGVLSYGKLRAAYGEVGTQPQPYLTAFTFLSGGTYLDGWGNNLTATQGGFGGLFSDTTRAGKLDPNVPRSSKPASTWASLTTSQT